MDSCRDDRAEQICQEISATDEDAYKEAMPGLYYSKQTEQRYIAVQKMCSYCKVTMDSCRLIFNEPL